MSWTILALHHGLLKMLLGAMAPVCRVVVPCNSTSQDYISTKKDHACRNQVFKEEERLTIGAPRCFHGVAAHNRLKMLHVGSIRGSCSTIIWPQAVDSIHTQAFDLACGTHAHRRRRTLRVACPCPGSM
jgi:hypothetical protein